MKQSKKYDFHVMQVGESWSVEIIRRVSTKKTVVSKRENGFSSEQDAEVWGKTQAEALLKEMNLKAQKKRREKDGEQDEDIV